MRQTDKRQPVEGNFSKREQNFRGQKVPFSFMCLMQLKEWARTTCKSTGAIFATSQRNRQFSNLLSPFRLTKKKSRHGINCSFLPPRLEVRNERDSSSRQSASYWARATNDRGVHSERERKRGQWKIRVLISLSFLLSLSLFVFCFLFFFLSLSLSFFFSFFSYFPYSSFSLFL